MLILTLKYETCLGRAKLRCEYNVAINLKEVRCGCMAWNHWGQNTMQQQQALHDMVKKPFKVNKTRRLLLISALLSKVLSYITREIQMKILKVQ
jgi:hypothetical protein